MAPCVHDAASGDSQCQPDMLQRRLISGISVSGRHLRSGEVLVQLLQVGGRVLAQHAAPVVRRPVRNVALWRTWSSSGHGMGQCSQEGAGFWQVYSFHELQAL